MSKSTVTINGKPRELQHWPARPGLRFAREIGKAFLELSDLESLKKGEVQELFAGINIDALFNEDRIDVVMKMVAAGLVFETEEFAAKEVEAASFPEIIAAAEAVVRHNMGFLMGHLETLMKSSATSTKRASKPRA